MATRKTTTTQLRRCIGSTRFGIEPHEAATSEFPKQPSRKDGLGLMCAIHWKAYVKGLTADRKAKAGTTSVASPTAKATTKRERRRTPMANKPEPARVRKAEATIAATEPLGGSAYTDAIASDEVQAALETLNGHGTAEPADGQVLVAGVLYDAETLEEAVETPLGEIIDAGTEEADAA